MQMTRAQYDQALDFATQPLEDQVARLTERLRRRDAEIEELRAVLQGFIDLGGTMGSALYAETVDRAARRALADAR